MEKGPSFPEDKLEGNSEQRRLDLSGAGTPKKAFKKLKESLNKALKKDRNPLKSQSKKA